MRKLGVLLIALWSISVFGQSSSVESSQKRPLTHADYDQWESIKSYGVDAMGDLAFAIVTPQEGDGYLGVYQLASGQEIARIPRVTRADWLPNTVCLLVKQDPPEAEIRQLKLKKTKKEDLPQAQAYLLTFASGAATGIARIDTLGAINRWGIQEGYDEKEVIKDEIILERPAKDKEKPSVDFLSILMDYDVLEENDTMEFVMGSLDIDTVMSFKRVLDWGFPKQEQNLYASWYVITENEASKLAELHWGHPEIAETAMEFSNISFAFSGIIYHKKDRKDQEYPSMWYRDGAPEGRTPQLIAEFNSPGLPPGYGPYAGGRSHTYRANIQTGAADYAYPVQVTQTVKAPEWNDSTTLPEERAKLDVWTWHDDQIQPLQTKRKRDLENPTLWMTWHPNEGLKSLSTHDYPEAVITSHSTGGYVIRYTQEPHEYQYSWDVQIPYDVEVVNVHTGQSVLLGKNLPLAGAPQVNPQGTAITFYDLIQRAWFMQPIEQLIADKTHPGMGFQLGAPVRIPIPHPVYDQEHDSPSHPNPYGAPGWTSTGFFVVYDAFDIWGYSLQGELRQLTEGGRKGETRYRIVNPEAQPTPYVDQVDQSLIVRIFHEPTKAAGLAVLRFKSQWNAYAATSEPGGNSLRGTMGIMGSNVLFEPVTWGDFSEQGYKLSMGGEKMLFLRENVAMCPSLFVYDYSHVTSSADFNLLQLTHLNSQQDGVIWPEVRMVTYRAMRKNLQGLLYTPEGAQGKAGLPLVVYFYETYSDQLHDYKTPAPSASTVNISWFCSNGYAVFIPDIVYRDGHPGQSALECINKGVAAALKADLRLDEKRMGLQGQSWGGYQTAYLVTQTDRYVCGMAGAPVSNMFSAYGGIRYGSGMSRQFQYEKTQSRIGATPWEKEKLYRENSPVFFADKVETPLLIMHNDSDGAVPYTQGIEYFMALKRLQKPVWMLVYNEEEHNLVRRANRKDLSQRMGEFFDHYLKGATQPDWMAQGRPITEKPVNAK
jgi:dienelactone hydrolase